MNRPGLKTEERNSGKLTDMGYKVLITLDLPGATAEQRKTFYEVLLAEKWVRVPSLTTTWTASFTDDLTRDSAASVMQKDLLKAKNESDVKKVEYAMQLDKGDVFIENL